MILKSNPVLRRAIRLALYAGIASTTVISVPAFAAEDAEGEIDEEVVVTGSRIQRNISETASPISVYTSEDIAAGGFTTVKDFVQSIPAVTGGSIGSTVNNGSGGVATTALRGLGSGRTLILIDGLRVNSITGDLNSIPAAFIERVEVLRDGASTIYGSDAIAGVINFITKKDFEGVEMSGQYDVTSEGDGDIKDMSMTLGTVSDRGYVTLGASYTDREEIWQGDRDFSECPIWEGDGEKFCGGSGTAYPGQAFPDSGGAFVVDNGVARPFDQSLDAYNYAAASYLATPQTLYSFFGNARYELYDGAKYTSVSAFAQAGFTNRQSEQLMAPVGTFWSPAVPVSNPGNIFGEPTYVARRLVESGGRRFTQDVNDYRVVVGLDGELSNEWNWDVSYQYSRFVDNSIVYGQLNQPRTETLLDPDLCAGDPNCPGVWDPFSTDTLTPEMQDYALVTHSPVERSTLQITQFNLVGDTGEFGLPAGTMQWSVGYSHSEEDYLNQPDGAASLGMIYFVAADKTEGSVTTDEFYGELLIPLLADMPFAERLDFNVSARNTDYDYLSSSHTSWKFGVDWEPMNGLNIRATQADGFRGATIDELFGAREKTALTYSDPCESWGASGNQNVRDNCASDGLPQDFALNSDQATAWQGGNPDLEPEESDSWTIGLTYTPEFLADFTMSLDYFNIQIDDAIGTAGVANVINGCYESEGFSSPICALIEGPSSVGEAPGPGPYRNNLGSISGVILTNANLANFETAGIDFDFRYTFDNVWRGGVELGVQGTWVDKYEYQLLEGTPTVDAAGYVDHDQWEKTQATFPEWRTNLSASYYSDDWSAVWIARYQSETEDIHSSSSNLDNYADSVWYHDVQGSYQWGEMTTLTLGVRNLFDEEPPYITAYDDMNTINMSYDTAGRYLYGRVVLRF